MAVRQEVTEVGDWRICVKETGEVIMTRECPKLRFTGKYVETGNTNVFNIDEGCRREWMHEDNLIHRTYLLSWIHDHLDEIVAGFSIIERGRRLIRRAFSGRPAAPA